MLKKILLKTASLMIAGIMASCSSGSTPLSVPSEPENLPSSGNDNSRVENFTLCKGGDIGWLSQMEAQGIPFFYKDGTKGDCMEILKSVGMNAFRFRIWVDPENGYCSTEDVLKMAKRAVALDMDVMLDFHYSDSWADPGKQTIPKAWSGLDLEGLCAKVSSYTEETLNLFKKEGVTPKWVQVGNETSNGMLWPYGQADKNPDGYVKLNNAGYDAVKKVFPDAKVILHIANAQKFNDAQWLIGTVLYKRGGKFDVCGFSLYPEPENYSTFVSQAKNTMKYCIDAFGKDVMLCEVGMGNSYVSECESFLRMCFGLADQLPAEKYLGLLYWEPQCYNDWQGYRKGAFTSKGAPSDALNAYSDADSSVPEIKM